MCVCQALDCIMTQAVRTSIQFNTVGRSFFPAKGEVLDVGFGKEVPYQYPAAYPSAPIRVSDPY